MARSTSKSSWLTRLVYTDRPAADDRSRMRAVLNNAILHLHPTTVPAEALRFRYTWGLGGISLTLAVLLALTGLLLMFRYDASVERAYMSVQSLETQTPFGSLVRGVHHWSANLLVITVILHLLRVFFTGGFKAARAANWRVGLGLLLVVLAFNFTGYLLPWDQLAYWAVTVSVSLLGYLPVVGKQVSNFVLAGPEVGQPALRNFYGLHVAVLPALMVAGLSYHFWKIRKSGGVSQPAAAPGERPVTRTTLPHLVQREAAVAGLTLLVALAFAMLRPAPLAEMADPLHSPNPAKAAWYFLGLQELLLHMDALAALGLTAAVFAALFYLPRLDRQEDNVGVYFRSAKGRWACLIGAVLALYLVPALVILDEFWIDLPGWLPAWPVSLTNGLIPLALTLAGLALVYALLRLALKANPSEALAGWVTFLAVGLLALTVIGIFFRGPNMALVLPF